MLENIAVISSCTLRKRSGLGAPVTANHCRPDTYSRFADQWIAASSKCSHRTPAGTLYVGRAVTEAKSAATFLKANLFFASTGFGLVQVSEPLPHYDLTIAQGHSNLRHAIHDESFSAHKWWAAINAACGRAAPIHSLLAQPNTLIFLALSRAYIEMVQEDLLAAVNEHGVDRLRVFTSCEGAKQLPPELRPAWIPYDDRFDGPSSPNPGTRSDFPQRVMNHFVREVFSASMPDLASERTRVTALMNTSVARTLAAHDHIRKQVSTPTQRSPRIPHSCVPRIP